MLGGLEAALGRVARRRRLSVLLMGALPMVLRLFLLPWIPIPHPRVQDEFSHLLVADTFAHGRVVNPVHPLSVAFESMHILVRPVYASVYPVAPGMLMGAAQAITGQPWFGVWLAMGMMCAAMCWMLQGWVSPGWALLGGAVVVARWGVLSYWMNSYYGGAVAAAAGALVLGALPRIVRGLRPALNSAVMTIGLVVLANSRPYEGAMLGALVLGALAVWMWRARPPLGPILLPMAVLGGAAAVLMGFYFAQFSGNPLVLPYAYYRNTATIAPHFIFQLPRPAPVFHHRVLRDFHAGWEMSCYYMARANISPWGLLDKSWNYLRFYFGPFLGAAIVLALPWLVRRRRARFLLLGIAFMAVALAVQVWFGAHYAAPVLGVVVLLAVEALRQMRPRFGLWPARALLFLCLINPVVTIQDAGLARAQVVDQLMAMGGRHLAVVRYTLDHDPGNEWVYNAADIDSARIVWAREMDPASNRNLVQYFHNRHAWLIEPDATPPRVTGYDPSTPPDPPFAFVKLGTPEIEAVRSPEKVRGKILEASANEAKPLNCDQWNWFFTEATGVGPPNSESCFPGGHRSAGIAFEDWFAWLRKQQ